MTKETKRELIFASIITVIMAFMDISGLPSALFLNIQVADITPFYFTLMLNFVFTGIVCFVMTKLLCPHWKFGLKLDEIGNGLKKYGLVGLIVLIITTVAFWYGLQPFDYTPTFAKVLIEGFVYYIGVGFIEELYVRGFLLNIIEKLFGNRKNATLWAVVISSVIFGLGHFFGMIGMPILTIVFKLITTIGLGLYFGAIYKKTGNLWVPIILHIVMDFCGVPFCFKAEFAYPIVSLIIMLPVYILLGVYGIRIILKRDK